MIPTLGVAAWVRHLVRIGAIVGWHATGSAAVAALSLPVSPGLLDSCARILLLSLWSGPVVLAWFVRHGMSPVEATALLRRCAG
jgi:hypothetical protein